MSHPFFPNAAHICLMMLRSPTTPSPIPLPFFISHMVFLPLIKFCVCNGATSRRRHPKDGIRLFRLCPRSGDASYISEWRVVLFQQILLDPTFWVGAIDASVSKSVKLCWREVVVYFSPSSFYMLLLTLLFVRWRWQGDSLCMGDPRPMFFVLDRDRVF